MDVSDKLTYRMNCMYISDMTDRDRYVTHRQMLFKLFYNLDEYFDTDCYED